MARNSYYRSAHWKALREAALRHYGRRCSVPGCGGTHGLTVDHRSTRPNSDFPTAADTLGNLRILCSTCDRKVKELADGRRRNGGIIPGADFRGVPVDPNHWWHRS
jgi:5-methylcytosine-specific restriction endonuclease McrA